ncbi:B3 domain-containing transcription factor VRN1-like [Cucumis melo var. makuwa]|uniref:B3 domain-containing transcription factor VRN1-like n=1 Tax=Cucumis melo var. makuwa TaxID=1194695 RepID=A0A5D3CQU5_CUCMM|nr:B3 domain-containing transcription factor VRN1-like [Cucumis melo var. makuwa]TYK13732.1 B3 domain-containing transcription factor VRN1-like [Cucumis melo var. makuwa]
MASSSSSMPHFFKVILPQTLTQKKLEVPKKFVRKYGEALKAEEVWLKIMFDNKKMFEEKRKSVQETLPIKRARKEVHEDECVPQTLYKKMKTSDEVGANKVIWRSHELQEVEMKKNTEDLKSSDLKKEYSNRVCKYVFEGDQRLDSLCFIR